MVLNFKDKKINIAIIGGSYNSTIAKTHLRSILSTNKFNIVSGCFSQNKNKNKKNSIFYSINRNKIYNDINTLINNEKKNIDLALVLTPPANRNKIYYKLALNNIGIIAEKPFEGNLQNASKIYKFLKRKKIFFVSTYNYLGYPAIMEFKPLIKKLGVVNNLHIEMPQQSSTLKNNKMKLWRLKDRSIPNLHLDLASHLFSIIIYVFKKLPLKVNSFSSKNKKKYIDNSYVWLDFKTFIGHLWFSKNATGKRNDLSIQIFGTKGSLTWTHNNPEIIRLCDNKGNITTINRLSKNTKYLKNNYFFTYSAGHPSGFLDAFINIYNEIYKTFKTKKKSQILLSLKDNLNIIDVLKKIYTASQKKKWQKIRI